MESETEKAILKEIQELRSEVRGLRARLRTMLVLVFLIVFGPAIAALGPHAIALTAVLILALFLLDHYVLKPNQSKPEYDSI